MFGVQPVNIKRFWGAARQYQAILGCSPSISSDVAEILQNHAKKLDLAERIRMHRSRASGASNLLRYGLFCMALWCTLCLLVNGLERVIMAHGHMTFAVREIYFSHFRGPSWVQDLDNAVQSGWATEVSEIGQQSLLVADGIEESQGRKDHGILATYKIMTTTPWLRKHGWAEGRET